MAKEVRPVIVDFAKERNRRKEAKKKVRSKILKGELPTPEEAATARGMVIAEREDSIFSDAWITLALIFLIAGFIANRNLALLALGSVMVLIVAVSTWWKNNALVGVIYERHFDRTRVFPGEPIKMTAGVSNNKPLPLTWLQFGDTLPVSPEEEGAIAKVIGETYKQYVLKNSYSLSSYGQRNRTVTLAFPRRGYYHLGPVTYRSGDIFTLFTIERTHDYRDTLVVYPRIYPLEQLGLPVKEPFGEMKVRHSLFTDPIKTQGIRDYHPRDRFRDVHWKATARRGELQTKVYDPSTGMTMAVFLNVNTFAHHWMGYDPEQLERAVSVAASAVNYGAQQKWGIGLYANGSVPRSDQPIRVPPSRSPDQLSYILEALAATTEFATGSIEKLMQQESPNLPWIATFVLVTAIVTDEIAAVLVQLKEAGRRVALISLAEEEPPPLPGILTYHVPPDTPAFSMGPSQEKGQRNRTVTEAALNAIPTPEPVELGLEQREDNGNGSA